MADRILFVDDELNVLNALQRQFRKQYEVFTAMGGARALQMVDEDGPFAVIVCDMQMPDMNGIQVLQQMRKIAPDSVRLMLTGNADQNTAIGAVNEGSVYSFLNKPCPPEKMVHALASAVDKHHRIVAERELLEGTLNGAVKLLMDMMSMVAPDIFGRTLVIRDSASMLAKEMQLDNIWDLELSAMLCNLAVVTLPPETVNKLKCGEQISEVEQGIVMRMPEIGRNLVVNIPRLENVSEIVYYHQKHFDGSGFPHDNVSGDSIPVASRILKVLCDLEQLKAGGESQEQALQSMATKFGVYDPSILRTAAAVLGAAGDTRKVSAPLNISLYALRPGHVLVSRIETLDGRLLFSSGHKMTSTIIERLLNYHRISKIKEPISVIADDEGDSARESIAASG